MSSVVVDTDVISFLFKNHPIGSRYDPELAGRSLPISFMTLAELDRWAIQARRDRAVSLNVQPPSGATLCSGAKPCSLDPHRLNLNR